MIMSSLQHGAPRLRSPGELVVDVPRHLQPDQPEEEEGGQVRLQ